MITIRALCVTAVTVCVHRTRRFLELKLRHLVWTLNLRRAGRWLLHEGIKLFVIQRRSAWSANTVMFVATITDMKTASEFWSSCIRVPALLLTWASWWGCHRHRRFVHSTILKIEISVCQILYYYSTGSCVILLTCPGMISTFCLVFLCNGSCISIHFVFLTFCPTSLLSQVSSVFRFSEF
jgi:hypothetical protein